MLYVLMSLGVLLSLYTAVAFRKADASGLSAIVFICIVIAFPDIEQPLLDALDRILGVLVGTAVAIGVNVARLPRSRNRKRIFFVRSEDLVPDRFAQISPSVLFRLNSLCRDGAKICLISRHAPAFFVSQMSAVTLNLPMIVMDGAALYDVGKGRYVRKEAIREADAAALMEKLERMNLSYFLYAIHRNRTCIFHRGELTEPERGVLNQLRSSPYRSYLDGEVYAGDEIVYFKLIGPDADIERMSKQLHTFLRGRRLRAAVQAQNGAPGVSGLYIYSERATVRKAEHHLMQLLEKTEANLSPEELFLPGGYRSEHDAMSLLHHLYNRYAPIRFPRLRRGGNP
ncbi:MAG: hypothetical protein IKR84_02660 [Oscillibacter sp.]|nr:hypothetical protein [Oscillibacter sp.]